MKKDRAKSEDPQAPPYDYDVFISYSSKDKEWVRGELLKRIEEAGLRAFIDFRDFTPGAPSIKGMEHGVTKSAKTLLVLTPDYVESEWCELENNMSLGRSPANRDGRRIPLLKAECEKPLHLAHLTHVDFSEGADVDLGWRQLLTALGKAPEPPQPMQPSREHWNLVHPYAMPPNFTGRLAERKMLTDWLTHDTEHPLLVLRALGGFGKSALTWHWLLHDVDAAQWPRVVWWSFYESDASFESFVAKALQYLSGRSLNPSSASPRDQLDSLLKALHSRGTLLILDGFERALRAFSGLGAAYQGDETVSAAAGERDCLSQLADSFLRSVASLPGMHGKVLLTTRLRPAPVETRGGILLEGCREEELVQLQPADAVAFFHAQGIRGGRAEIKAACEPYGYHPLSLRLLAGLIVGDLQRPGDISAAQRLDVSGDVVQRQHHVLEQAYTSLGLARQKVLSRIACFRSPVSYDALKALDDIGSSDSGIVDHETGGLGLYEESRDTQLRDLIARGLMHRELGTNRFDLHPIVRRYAYDRLAATDRASVHARLRDYFAAVPESNNVRSLDDLSPVIELYHHTVRAGQYDEACTLFYERLKNPIYYQLGAYQLEIELFGALLPDADNPSRLKSEGAQAWMLSALSNSYSISGQPHRAVPLCERSLAIRDRQGDKSNVATGLGNVADDRIKIGALRAAETDLRRRIALCREIKDDFKEAVGYAELGRLLAFRGRAAESGIELAKGQALQSDNPQFQGVIWAYRALCELLRLRCTTLGSVSEREVDSKSALGPARYALELADKTAGDERFVYPVRDYIRAHWLMGAAHRAAGQMVEAETHLNEALERCRRINMVDHEADILVDLARLRMATSALDEAGRLAGEALVITERCGYVLQGADAHLVLAQLAKDRGDLKELREHATEALRLATCDGPPDYTYKAAYDEATALLR